MLRLSGWKRRDARQEIRDHRPIGFQFWARKSLKTLLLLRASWCFMVIRADCFSFLLCWWRVLFGAGDVAVTTT